MAYPTALPNTCCQCPGAGWTSKPLSPACVLLCELDHLCDTHRTPAGRVFWPPNLPGGRKYLVGIRWLANRSRPVCISGRGSFQYSRGSDVDLGHLYDPHHSLAGPLLWPSNPHGGREYLVGIQWLANMIRPGSIGECGSHEYP